MTDTYHQFSRLVENYSRYRPHYPRQILEVLESDCGYTADQVVADVGSGTGILTALFLNNGNRTFGVEPNNEMRLAAEESLHPSPRFTSITATAESTTLDDQSIDLITSGEAFHYFDRELTRPEFQRILRPNGWVALVWNVEVNTGGLFSTAFEDFWHQYVDTELDFAPAQSRPDFVTNFFGEDRINQVNIPNPHVCDFPALAGRILSSRRVPQQGEPGYNEMIKALWRIFDEHAEDGTVTVEYETHLIYGQLTGH